jgi:hypothetical protein
VLHDLRFFLVRRNMILQKHFLIDLQEYLYSLEWTQKYLCVSQILRNQNRALLGALRVYKSHWGLIQIN